MKHENSDSLSATGEFYVAQAAGQGDGFYTAFGKRAFDIVFAILLLPFLIPVIFMLWVLTVRDGGVGFYGHERIGKNGVRFQCWKIRSMVANAEEKLTTYLKDNPEAAAEWASSQKLTTDPRVTRFGRILRSTSLDELPQIWNVLKGEMSFVGPRPVIADELLRYRHGKATYLSLTPGITGLWQTSGRNDTSYDERVRFDILYSHQISFRLDCLLIIKTASAIFGRTGR
ncbi:sugar transferase [Cognatiyoonia koreensis]|uniref:sugar transferase n=1 Tax=Cognatiyoonia koreensis TaxID=364200 RepID=UPI001F611297|nr:sugar transferase [Cognatiyoonia koreensis]